MMKDYSCIEELNHDIAFVSQSVINIASSTIFTPTNQNHNHGEERSRIFNTLLSSLCWHSRVAYKEWKVAGCPRSGDKFKSVSKPNEKCHPIC